MEIILYRVVDEEIESKNHKTLWEPSSSDRHGVTYDENGYSFDCLDPISKVFKKDGRLFVKHHLANGGVVEIDVQEIKDLGFTCRIEKEPFMGKNKEYIELIGGI